MCYEQNGVPTALFGFSEETFELWRMQGDCLVCVMQVQESDISLCLTVRLGTAPTC